jgi:hypothetical protein
LGEKAGRERRSGTYTQAGLLEEIPPRLIGSGRTPIFFVGHHVSSRRVVVVTKN